jgi:hypothetical protein
MQVKYRVAGRDRDRVNIPESCHGKAYNPLRYERPAEKRVVVITDCGDRFDMLLGRPLNMTQAISERRAMRRFDMRLPAVVRINGQSGTDLETVTDNVSARGIFFRLPEPLALGDRLSVTLTFPPHVTLTDRVRVRFDTSVVRVEARREPGAPVGIAAAIDAYEFLRNYPFADPEE